MSQRRFLVAGSSAASFIVCRKSLPRMRTRAKYGPDDL